MSREVKFRVWSDYAQKMFQGTNQYGGDEPNCVLKTSTAGAFTRMWEAIARIQEDEACHLMQYTGLKDKNGKPIYEGDLIKHEGIGLGEVVYDESFAAFKIKFAGTTRKWFVDMLGREYKLITVVGNIHEHSHLLEQGNEPKE